MTNNSSKVPEENIPYSFLYEQHLIEKTMEQALKIKPNTADIIDLMSKEYPIAPHKPPYKTMLDILREKKRI
ncbi:hypothetical protein A3K80_08570 [Candidatus Bathyarchaeota archaeon RBG_13_38_9]|nr:MAG: hypothetical protein A3K80_08570 [Candidatus Bathyarchaeota archaeon RBG_13_38_9]